MRLPPASIPARIGAVAAAAALIATVGGTTAASAAVRSHPQQPRHEVGHAVVGDAARQTYRQKSASPSPTPAVGKVLTALSIGVFRQVAHKHRITAVIDGRLFEPNESDHGVRGKIVLLLREGAGGHWAVVGREFTGPHGGVAFGVHVRKSATFRLVFPGTPNFRASISATETIS
ncbi:MAG TPA: hypothetical protein VEH05_07795 [Streptosporangiaceae bacterium]|nr:hypothetical protein [Streptosporangiaceae bacterium]